MEYTVEQQLEGLRAAFQVLYSRLAEKNEHEVWLMRRILYYKLLKSPEEMQPGIAFAITLFPPLPEPPFGRDELRGWKVPPFLRWKRKEPTPQKEEL